MDKFYVYLFYLIIFLLPILSNGLGTKGLIIIRHVPGRKYTGNLINTTESTTSKCEEDKVNCKNGLINETFSNQNLTNHSDNPINNLIFQNNDVQLDENNQRHSDNIQINQNENIKQNNYASNYEFTNQNTSNDEFNDRRNPYSNRRNRKNFNLEKEEQLSDNQMLIKLNNLKMRLNSTLNKLPYKWEFYK